ncbi:MAG: DUF502 domain-containing protein [Flavobacteriales bacterium]|nr:DUF502 domain-containing protein [Flavobacteriales bacterium]MBV6484947.1 hypothetical protein [Flavobacteriales bacterium]MBX2958665.1 DUF502 domain-containing protein [Flavobacteriales bacterium]MCL4856696.1 DUF502 domain-containing protein [Flavobacteriales bacterium]
MMKRILSYFLQGLLYTLPVFATVYVIIEAIIFVDGIIPVKVPGLGLLIILSSLTLIGFIGTRFITPNIISVDKYLDKVPLIKTVYTSVKDLLSAFVGKKKRFTEPVLVKMEGNVERFGFVTQHDLTDLGISADKVAVYIPFSYALTGNLIVVPKTSVSPVDGNSADIMKFVISGGVTEIEENDEEVETKPK